MEQEEEEVIVSPQMLQRIEKLLEEREDNPVHLLTNPPSWFLHPVFQAALGGAASALIDAMVTKWKADSTGLAVSAAAKGALGFGATMVKVKGRQSLVPMGAALMGAASYQGAAYAAGMWKARQAAATPPPPESAGGVESGAYIPRLPPGYSYVPGVGYVPQEMLNR